MFPIFNANGKIVAFSGRSLDGSEPKYINTTDTELFHKRRTIFGFNFARDAIHRANRSIVVEGQIDAIQMQCNGFPETVAPLGTALTEDHVSMLCKANRNITFCFDGDAAGQKAAARACDIVMSFLRDTSDIRFAFVSGGKDPDEILKKSGAAAMHKIIDNSVALVDFLWNLVNAGFTVSTPNGRTQAEKFLKQKIEKITDTALRSEYEHEYNSRMFNEWHKWKKNKNNAHEINLPQVDTITQKTVPLIFIFQTQRKNDLIHFLKRVEFEYPVCIDTNSSFEHLNHFPKDERFQTFLLDKEHRVIAIGNPIYNPRIKELYLKIIKGETITNNYSTALTTTTSINHTTINLGEFDWRQEQTGTFILSNTGSRPLVIEMINTSCGCTTVEYEKEPVRPGESTALQVTYKAEQPEHFNKTITVYCNAEESPIKLKVSGNAI